jgi:hypothetical protein
VAILGPVDISLSGPQHPSEPRLTDHRNKEEQAREKQVLPSAAPVLTPRISPEERNKQKRSYEESDARYDRPSQMSADAHPRIDLAPGSGGYDIDMVG